MAVFTYLLVLIIIIAVIFYLYSKWTYSYWKRRGVPTIIEPELFYGNCKELLRDNKSLGEQFMKFYKPAKSQGLKHIGVYTLLAKIYVPIDLEIIKNLLQKDFVHFMNHGGFSIVNEEVDPLSGHLFNLENEKWRNLRAKLTPTFTSGKLKMMFQTLVDCTPGLEDILNDHAKMGDAADIKDIIARFTTDIIGSCAFGLDCNSLKNPNSEFLYYGKKFFNPDFYTRMKNMLPLVFPINLIKFLRISGNPVELLNFFRDIVNKTVKYREDMNIFRKDFLHMLLQIKNKGKVTDDESIVQEGTQSPTMSMDELTAQCFVFFVAGFETSATTMTFTLLELAQNQEIQDKLREDIISTLAKHNGKVTYESIMEMEYLNKVIHEALRKHPPVCLLPRVCTKEYHVPGTDIVIEKDTFVHIPTLSIHRDPEYYPDPEKFDPERFSEENKAKRPQFAFLPFGEGPRVCIGARFALMQVKVGLITIIKNFRFTLNDKTPLPIEYLTQPIVNEVKGGVWLNVSKIN